jgi:hypothetical protein
MYGYSLRNESNLASLLAELLKQIYCFLGSHVSAAKLLHAQKATRGMPGFPLQSHVAFHNKSFLFQQPGLRAEVAVRA